MKILAAMTVKDEDDIVADTLAAAAEWADHIIVMDNMSVDRTWRIVEELAARDPRIIPWGRYAGPFRDALRQRIFEDFGHLSQPGDWWCRLDADEIYIDDPREFISRQPPRIDSVWNASFHFYWTPQDFDALRSQGGEASWRQLRHYACNWSELRFFKHRSSTIWPSTTAFPIDLIAPAPERIRLKHYQYRSPSQFARRQSIRQGSHDGIFQHEKQRAAQWYAARGFALPEDERHQEYRVVNADDLEDSSDYSYDSAYPAQVRLRTAVKIRSLTARALFTGLKPVLARFR